MNRYPPFFGDGTRPRSDFLGYHYGGPSAYGWTVFALQLVIVLGIVWLVASLLLGGRLGRGQPAAAAAGPVLPPRAGDDALTVLRMRYAKGEIEREQYLLATADLGGEAETETPTPPPS
jgi:uncharacterized membrane protein